MIERQPGADDGHAGASWTHPEEMIQRTRSMLGPPLRQQPYVVLSAALAVGYVLAAGVPRAVMGYIFRYGIRAGVATGVRRVLSSMMEEEEEPATE